MLEGLAAWVLNTYVGEYVENLNTDQLSIALLQGAVELENLPLKQDALKSLDFPLEVKSGLIGKITLKIPLSRLRSEPWVISIEKLYLVAGPLTNLQYDEEKEKEIHQKEKQSMLDALEAKWKVPRQGKQSELASSSWFSYGTSMAANILENIQLHVKDVHLRYEDDKLNPACPFACGVIIKSLSAQSSDGNWIPKFVSSDAEEVVFKLADLQNFGIYCDTNTAMLGKLSLSELSDAMQRQMYVSTIDGKFNDHCYILKPISAQARVKRRTSALPLRSPSTPRITVDIKLEKIGVVLISEQYQCLLLWQREFERHGRRRRYRKYHPSSLESRSSRRWWHFAINCHLCQIRERNKRLTKEFIVQQMHKVVSYCRAYSAYLTEDNPSSALKTTKTQLEEELDFEELKIMREVVLFRLRQENRLPNIASRKSPSGQDQASNGGKAQAGLFQRWFPGWSGWSQSSVDTPPDNDTGVDSSVDKDISDTAGGTSATETLAQAELEQEIMDVISDSTENSSLLRKDTVFARMSFALSKGSFELLESRGPNKASMPLAELQCSTISMEFESRPRTSAMKFKVAVGGLYLQDKTTSNHSFPYLMSPQSQDPFHQVSTSIMSHTLSPPDRHPPKPSSDQNGEWKFFELLYEKNPPSSFFRYGASIKTRPLDIVYSQSFLKKVKEFFSSPVSKLHKAQKSHASAWQFEALKKQTPEEFMETLDQLFETEGLKTRWDVNLDISAPKLIIPENYTDPNSKVVVIDLGKFCLQTISSKNDAKAVSTPQRHEENEDDFHTPMSTPPNETSEKNSLRPSDSSLSVGNRDASSTSLSGLAAENRDASSTSLSCLSTTTVHDHLYERYKLDLTDMQVLLGRPQDNWRHAYTRISSRMHIIDRFTISLQLERRLIVTADPQWPKMTLSGTLPTLTFHLNERKIQALGNCVDIMSTSSSPEPGLIETASSTSLESEAAYDLKHTVSVYDFGSIKEKEDIDNKLVVLQFLIHNLSVEVQSQGQALVEMRVTGVQADMSKKPQNTSLKLTVHSLLVVDALQSYGADFELLIASHKNLVLDSRSGSIRGSEAGSPTSPASPRSPSSPRGDEFPSPLASGGFQAIQDAISSAFHAVVTTAPTDSAGGEGIDQGLTSLDSATAGGNKSEALIILEYEAISSEVMDSEKSENIFQLLNLQFNSLDFIANQETIVEILSFMKRTFPSNEEKQDRHSTPSHATRKQNSLKAKEGKLLVTADFRRLNILLPRFGEKDGKKMGKKVATATMSTARVEANMDDGWEVEGSVGGLHLLDVTPEGTRYQQVLSVGEGLPDHMEGLVSPRTIPSAMYQTARDDTVFSDNIPNKIGSKKACSFTICKNFVDMYGTNYSLNKTRETPEELQANFDMASVYYTHCPKFLNELMDCMSEFKDYMSVFASSIGKAATEVAMNIVGGRLEKESHDISHGSLRRDVSLSDITDTVLLDETYESQISETNPSVSAIKVYARMETPIIVLPRTPVSSEVLLAHLGEITIANSRVPNRDASSLSQDLEDENDKVHISLSKMNLYSLDLEKQNTNFGSALPSYSLGTSYYNVLHDKGIPILYDTAVQLVISKRDVITPILNPDISSDFTPRMPKKSVTVNQSSSVLDVTAKISSSLKLVLSKDVYEQILQTLDNLAYSEDDFTQEATDPSEDQRSSDHSPASSASATGLTSAPQSMEFLSMQESTIQEGFLAKHVTFEVPLFEVELRGNFGDGERGIVDLKLDDFSMHYTKDNKYSTRMALRLKSLLMDDLLEPMDSSHRQIIVSKSSKQENVDNLQPKLFMSTSCPNSTIIAPVPLMPPSLPSSFHDGVLSGTQSKGMSYMGMSKPSRTRAKESNSCPQTPPSTPLIQEQATSDDLPTDDLVHIDVILVEKKSPEYVTKFDKTNRFIDINFSCLETTINLQTWVVLLDFLGMGAKVHDSETPPTGDTTNKGKTDHGTVQGDVEEIVNSEINFAVESFTLIFNKQEYELAQFSVANLQSHISLRDQNMSFKGQLGSLSLLDQSPHGEKYQERFVTVGRQALEFDFFKHGLPDFLLQRENDIYLKLRISSARYVHTNRFQSELLAFCQHFLQLQDVLGRMRAASAGKMISDTAMRGARIELDIEAGSPILLIPHSSKTDEVLVADLGKLHVVNSFIFDGSEGTIRFKDNNSQQAATKSNASHSKKAHGGVMHRAMTQSMFDQSFPPRQGVDLMSQSIYGSLEHDYREGISEQTISGEKMFVVHDVADIKSPEKEGSSVDPINCGVSGMKRPFSDSYISLAQKQSVEKTTDLLLPEKHCCLLDVWSLTLTDMDLYTARRVSKRDYKGSDLKKDLEFSTFVIQREPGYLLKEKCLLDLHVERNLEGDISHSAPDWRVTGKLSSVYCHLDVEQYKLIRGILGHNLGEKVEEFRTPLMTELQDPRNQTVLSGEVWKCVSMVVDLHNVTVELLVAHGQGPTSPEASLAKLDFIRSQLSYESFSDQTKDIDLVSHEIVVSDTRFKTQPMNSRPNVFVNILQPSSQRWNKDSLQMEMHFRGCPDSTCFTILVNNMKLMCIFDWLLSVQEFLLTDAENPFTEESSQAELPLSGTASKQHGRTQSPLNVSRGIVTRRGPFVDEVVVPFELRLNITDTQFVVVEDATTIDTNAVILKTTAVLMYKPQAPDKVMTCSLQSIEVFSCCLMSEDDTALSIIDPMTISIELNANPLPNSKPMLSCGLLEATTADQRQLLLEINFKTMTTRVSYHDMMLFLAILNSLPQQALQAKHRHNQHYGLAASQQEESLLKLMELGFKKEDCEKALMQSGNQTDDAALWLTKYAKHQPAPGNKQSFELTAIELKATSICLCLIDDCGDADVPLAEISFSGIDFHQTMEPYVEGKAVFYMTGEYYNRNLSGWEPFLETWRCMPEWKQYVEPEKKLAVQIVGAEILNINLTNTLIDQYNQTMGSWTADYWEKNREDQKLQKKEGSSTESSVPSRLLRRRLPFVPYMIHNDTGCNLWFLTATSTPTSEPSEGRRDSSPAQRYDNAYIQASDWKRVCPGEAKPFYFHRREKLRHKKTHEMHINQLVVTVEGWQRLSPVSVDKVGVYFRHAHPDKRSTSVNAASHHPARIVFDVQQEGTARKLIIVRSALIVVNKLDSPLELKMEATDETGQYQCVSLAQNTSIPIPLHSVYSRLWARPGHQQVNFCDRQLIWQHVARAGEYSDGMRRCDNIDGQGVYRFCVSVRRECYPEESHNDSESALPNPPLPGHTITLLPPVTVINLLPLELHYYLRGTNISGNLKPGKEATLHGADLSRDLDFGVHLENFPRCKEIIIPSSTTKYKVKLRVYDEKNRLLELVLRIRAHRGGSLRLSLQAPYWLVNKSGLPLVFRQDGARSEAAGQLEEHELARSVTPLLFSFSDKEAPYLCTMRVGKSVHGKDALPQWCQRFTLERGIGMRQLHIVPRQNNRPDWVYNIGIEVSPGRGHYRDTNIVTFAPRYVIDNQSHHKLAIAQRHCVLKGEAMSKSSDHLTTLPDCKLPFHWPRLDLDQLLCVKIIDHSSCHWSGGFRIDKVSSFHINMRDGDGECLLLKVEVVLQGPTFFILFANADVSPPPFRLDNLSEVPVLFYQSGVNTTDENLTKQLKPHSSIPYAWDEPTLDPSLTLRIPGGTSASYNMNKLESGKQLCYENFLYLAATATFNRNWTGPTAELVLDCVHDNNLVFKRKETGKRSQLWRMTSSGMLEHEGSMPPRDPHKKNATPSQGLVLDIADIAPQPGKCVPLILKKPDERRKSTQTWKFTEDGCLCCSAGILCVQAIEGISGLQDGAIAVLGPGCSPPGVEKTHRNVTPPHMLISRQKLRPGSGCLAVKVTMEGPIRVLQIMDLQYTTLVKRRIKDVDGWEVYDQQSPKLGPSAKVLDSPADSSHRCLEISLNLKGGLGISLVNSVPEELLFITLSNIVVEVTSTSELLAVDTSIAVVQVDNQLYGAQRKAVLFVTPSTNRDTPDNTPAIHVTAHKVPSAKWNADIYKHLVVSTKRLTVHLEERLLWKLMQFSGYNKAETDIQKLDENYDTHRALSAASSIQARRYYFGLLKLNMSRITLSMVTASKLPPELKAIKHVQSMTLVAFEDAKVDLYPFVRNHPFETRDFLLNEIMIHYTEELKSQAAKILGSVDFLGNPLGLFNDVTEGISGFIKDGNVGGLLKNVAHGVSNSAAKVASSISDGFATVSMDEHHKQTREQLRQQSGKSSEHLVAGIKGLGYGIFGGLTSVFTQPYEGAKEDGVEGFFKGVGKGVLGTVTKPVAGVFDLTSGVANAVRDTSRSSSRQNPSRLRVPRLCQGPGGLLPPYSKQQAEAQRLLYALNDNDFTEFLIALDMLRSGCKDSLHALITSKQVYFLRSPQGHHDVVLNILHDRLFHCRCIEDRVNNCYYLGLTMKADNGNGATTENLKRPQVRCDKLAVAQKVSQEINYAKNLHDEKIQTLVTTNTPDDLDF